MKLNLKNVSKKFGSQNALTNVSCTFESGNLTGIVGTNGAGKSTLMNIISTALKPDSGEVLLDDVNIVKHPQKMRQLIGYLPQNVAFYPHLNATEFLSYMASVKEIEKRRGEKEIERLLDVLNLKDTGKKRLSDFSGGMKQRVGIACALLGDPQILVVDEPTVGLDPQERISMRNLFAKQAEKKIVLLSTHIVSDIEAIASKILVLKSGKKVYAGSPQELIKMAENHVWEYMQENTGGIKELSGVSSFVQTDKGIKVRQIAEDMPCPNAKRTKPTLEDSCMYILEGKMYDI